MGSAVVAECTPGLPGRTATLPLPGKSAHILATCVSNTSACKKSCLK